MSTLTDVPRPAGVPAAHEAPVPGDVPAAREPSRRHDSPVRGAGTSRRTALKAAARKTASILTTAMTVVALALFLFLAVGPRVFGYQTSTMLTGSMAPLINPGDVVVTVPAPVDSITAGDIITYGIPVEDHRVETHRVVEVLADENGTTAVRTKGDANNGADPWTAALQGDTVHRHVFTVPYVGQVIRTLRQPMVQATLMYAAPGVLVAGLLASIWRRDPQRAAKG